MHKPLHSLAAIRTGHTFRGRITEDPQGDIHYVQIKDIKGQTQLRSETLPRTNWQGPAEPPMLGAGDILLPARGEYYDAVVADGAAPVVATSQFFVLRPRSDAVTADYLGWYLNRPEARSYFLTHRTGTSIPMLSKSSLGELPVPVPTLEVQHQILALQQLWEQEQELTELLLHNRERMLTGIFQQLLEQ